MTTLSKTKSHFKPVVDFESILESVKSHECFRRRKYKGNNLAKRLHANNQEICIDRLKPRSNKNVLDCKKYGCRYFYMPNYQSFLSIVLLIL